MSDEQVREGVEGGGSNFSGTHPAWSAPPYQGPVASCIKSSPFCKICILLSAPDLRYFLLSWSTGCWLARKTCYLQCGFDSKFLCRNRLPKVTLLLKSEERKSKQWWKSWQSIPMGVFGLLSGGIITLRLSFSSASSGFLNCTSDSDF